MDFNFNIGGFAAQPQVKSFDSEKIYDVLIIGGGPAGLTAAVYSLRKGLITGIVTDQVGGQMAETTGIENYLGYRYIDGMELVNKFRDQVLQFGIDFESKAKVKNIKDGRIKQVELEDGRVYQAKSIIIASGKQNKKLGLEKERELTGHGVAYCAICDAPFFADKRVVVAGGGNSGVQAAIDLAKVATHVTLVQRRDHLTADQILIDKLSAYSNVDYKLNHVLSGLEGDKKLTAVRAEDRSSKEEITLEADGLFVEIGLIPNSAFVTGLVEMNGYNEIKVDSYCRTNVDGIFAAGDVTTVPYKQIIVACGEGSKAALAATDYLLNSPDL
ncbi:MAG: NADH-dependent peroxiredoxin subunit [Clostridiales bacterium]|jgi:alkyl hydroperoxide reductase subunit F|nr:FAD-dependent oxidoreductase [Eubacteriales bacterium]MDD3198528.1 FAD-dependent oxidoreductase [Eubacteriales bacterium]MDD3504011.1 FAD-dependent oxidoreductase [Eubacteriales bacterium]MDD4683204.1 FAD-dependent oxidoreductase [Eubacteriales bacterium]MDN5315297.1 NADH-dependent peroxiredoxin subunit [Clostridiales bacterium]